MYSKKNKSTLIKLLILFIYLSLSAIGIYQIRNTDEFSVDTIQINRIAAEVETHFTDLAQGDYSHFTYPFAVLDNVEALLYTHGNPTTLTIQDMVQQSDIALTIHQNNLPVGTVLIEVHTARKQAQHSAQNKSIAILGGIFLLGLLLMLIYNHYLKQNILKPFQQLDDFSRKIALGDYEAPLQIHGNQAFLPLVKSLDIMRDELRTAKQHEYEANQSKKALVASLSHDIKTPITSIQLAVELLQVKVTDEDLRERLDAIMTKTTQIDHLVTDLFHTTMADMEELPVSPHEIYSNELIQLIHDADMNHYVRSLEIPECMIRIDPLRMGQIFTNIIYNSYKYANTSIDITGSILPEFLQITMRDYGPGVDSEELPCIFNRFYRGSNVGDQTGSGLGLYICKCLIDKMEGEIYCDNHERGFETILRIPLA